MIDRDRALIERAVAGLVEDRFNTEGLMEFSEREVSALLSAARDEGRAEGLGGWEPIETAKKDGSVIVAKLRSDIYPTLRPKREDLKPWNGVIVTLRHRGIDPDNGFDAGWQVAAPVGSGGIPDEWIEGWHLPAPPASQTQEG